MVVDLNVNVVTGLALKLVQSAPRTEFIIEHMGGAANFLETIKASKDEFTAWNDSIHELAARLVTQQRTLYFCS